MCVCLAAEHQAQLGAPPGVGGLPPACRRGRPRPGPQYGLRSAAVPRRSRGAASAAGRVRRDAGAAQPGRQECALLAARRGICVRKCHDGPTVASLLCLERSGRIAKQTLRGGLQHAPLKAPRQRFRRQSEASRRGVPFAISCPSNLCPSKSIDVAPRKYFPAPYLYNSVNMRFCPKILPIQNVDFLPLASIWYVGESGLAPW